MRGCCTCPAAAVAAPHARAVTATSCIGHTRLRELPNARPPEPRRRAVHERFQERLRLESLKSRLRHPPPRAPPGRCKPGRRSPRRPCPSPARRARAASSGVPCQLSPQLLLEVYFWKFMMRPNESAASDAPPTRQPSMSGRRISSSTVSPVTEPLRTHEAAAPQVSTGTRSSKETSMSGVETRRSPVEDARLVRGRLVVHLGDVRADELVHL